MADTKYVVFRLAKEYYGLEIGRVERILNEQKITAIPKASSDLLGVFELRGETLPVLDLRKRFDMGPPEGPNNFVVIDSPRGKCALRVDMVDGIAELNPDQIEPAHAAIKNADDQFIAGVGKSDGRLVVLLDPDHLLTESAADSVKSKAA